MGIFWDLNELSEPLRRSIIGYKYYCALKSAQVQLNKHKDKSLLFALCLPLLRSLIAFSFPLNFQFLSHFPFLLLFFSLNHFHKVESFLFISA